jgi:hypothetical protein
MEQITRVIPYPRTKPHIPSLRLPPYLRLVLVLISGFTLIILSIRLLPQTAVPPDPFTSLTDGLRGQTVTDLERRGFWCVPPEDYVPPSPSQLVCNLWPRTGIFSWVEVMFVEGEVRTSFALVREGELLVGDLVKLWGRPHIYQHDSSGQLNWLDNEDMALWIFYHGPYSLFLPVRSIVFTDGPD